MNNADKVIAGISEWLTNVAASVLPKINIQPNSSIGKMMTGIFGINPTQYNIWAELGFLLTPTIKGFVEPSLRKYLSAIPDADIEALVMTYIDSFIAQAQSKGYVNLFGVQLGPNAFEGLKGIMQQKFNQTNIKYNDDTRTETTL